MILRYSIPIQSKLSALMVWYLAVKSDQADGKLPISLDHQKMFTHQEAS